jgi:hypothetical protein
MTEITRKQIEEKGYKVKVHIEHLSGRPTFIATATDRYGYTVKSMANNEAQALQKLSTLITYS